MRRIILVNTIDCQLQSMFCRDVALKGNFCYYKDELLLFMAVQDSLATAQ